VKRARDPLRLGLVVLTLLAIGACQTVKGGSESARLDRILASGELRVGLSGSQPPLNMTDKTGGVVGFEVDVVEAVRAATDGRGVDVVYEAVGGDIFQQVRRTVAWDGRLLIIGFTSGTIPDAPMNHALLKNYSIVGVHWGAWLGRDPGNLRQNWDRIVELAGTGHIDPLISSVRPFEDAAQALSDLGNRKTVGKVVIEPSPGSAELAV